MRVIVGGVGYRNLRDHSIGVAVTDRLEALTWPAGVVVEDLSYNPIAVGQRLDDEPPDQRFERAVVVAAVERDGRSPGSVVAYRWDGVLPGDEEIQRAVTEAVTGVIALDNTLIVTRHFGALPDDVVVVEVTPAAHEFGDEFSDAVGAVVEPVCDLVRTLATDDAAVERLPRAPLGGAPSAPDVVSQPGDILENVQRLIVELQSHPDATVGARLIELLQGIDAIHRTALTHLVAAIQSMAGEAFINRLTSDPAIRLLMMSYDLISVDRRLHAEEALDTVRGHLHDHGIDVELAEVVGGAVYVRLHGLDRSGVALEAVRHDLEEALKAGLVGFQEMILGDRSLVRAPELLQVGGLRRAQRPVYRRVCATAELAPGAVKAVDVDGLSILIANVDGDIHAISNHCGDSPLPLQFSTLTGAELRCSWHGCRYDVRTGQRLDGPEQLAVFPASVQGGDIRVAVGVEPVAQG